MHGLHKWVAMMNACMGHIWGWPRGMHATLLLLPKAAREERGNADLVDGWAALACKRLAVLSSVIDQGRQACNESCAHLEGRVLGSIPVVKDETE